ncbi:MAG: hypothetical protein PHW96_04310 [Candidatus Nanoarchaeia archaeon]|nr:hypothetical protein [Candidatus Nanoarchaeia archaeon]
MEEKLEKRLEKVHLGSIDIGGDIEKLVPEIFEIFHPGEGCILTTEIMEEKGKLKASVYSIKTEKHPKRLKLIEFQLDDVNEVKSISMIFHPGTDCSMEYEIKRDKEKNMILSVYSVKSN